MLPSSRPARPVLHLAKLALAAALVTGAAIASPLSCRLYAVGLPCDVDAQCAPDQACVAEVCVAAEGEGEGGEGEGEDANTCASLLASSPASSSGVYTLGGIATYCDMDTAGGGWTLVARSAAGADRAAQPFGWLFATGAVDDVTRPYSRGVAPGRADELLVAGLGAGVAGLGADRFVVRFDGDASAAGASIVHVQRIGAARVLASECGVAAANDEPSFLRRTGCNELDDLFALNDTGPCDPFHGLFADGFNLNGTPPDDESDCATTGNLHGQQGLIFVRERRSCRSLHAADPAAPTGPATVDGATGDVTVWCDMDVEGGGWTLLARSVEGGDTAFGWTIDQGSLDDTSAPYSLDAVSAAVPAREMLIVEATPSLAPGPRQFLVAYDEQLNSPAFLTTDQQSSEALSVGSACVGEELGGTFMMQRAGCTSSTFHFYLRDNDQGICQNFGLFSGGFNLADVCCDVTACQRNGELLDRQGMIFVR